MLAIVAMLLIIHIINSINPAADPPPEDEDSNDNYY